MWRKNSNVALVFFCDGSAAHISKRHMTLFDFADENIICIYSNNGGNRAGMKEADRKLPTQLTSSERCSIYPKR